LVKNSAMKDDIRNFLQLMYCGWCPVKMGQIIMAQMEK